MNPNFKYAAAAALAGMLVVAAATPSEARHARHQAHKVVAVAVVKPITPGANVAGTGSYNEALTRADYAYEPQLGYSNALFFMVWPRY